MKKAKSNYPVGATWKLIKDGRIYWIEFLRVHGDVEVWMYGRVWTDGSGGEADWATSYQNARKCLYVPGRLKRVK